MVVAILALDAGVVFCEFAGSRLALPWIQSILIFVALAIPILALIAIAKPLRWIAGTGLLICGAYLFVSLLASSFVAEGDLGGSFGIIVALISGGSVIPPLVVLTMLAQAEWRLLLSFVAELAMLILATWLGYICVESAKRRP